MTGFMVKKGNFIEQLAFELQKPLLKTPNAQECSPVSRCQRKGWDVPILIHTAINRMMYVLATRSLT
jgi:hypothetical protein